MRPPPTPPASAPPARALAQVSLALTLVLAGCGYGTSAARDHFAWRGAVPAGGWVRVRNLNGPVRIARGGAQVVVTATKHRQGRRDPVRIVAVPDAEGVTVCALWDDGGAGRCTATEYGARSTRGGLLDRIFRGPSHVDVAFVVAVPAGVRVSAQTVNGSIAVADAAAEVQAKSINGGVTVGVRGGPVRASSVNGSVRAAVGALAPGATVALSTVNGPVTAMLDAPVDAAVELKTVNGQAVTDLPLAARDSARNRLVGVLGAGGGRTIVLSSVNGSVNLFRQ